MFFPSLLAFLVIAVYAIYFFKSRIVHVPALPQQNYFESIVPTAGENDDPLELHYGYCEDEFGQVEEAWNTAKPVLVEDEETVLLLEAERMMTEVERIAKDKVDVYPRLMALMDGYQLFYHTDYKDSLNRFIEETIQLECGINLTAAELDALWTE